MSRIFFGNFDFEHELAAMTRQPTAVATSARRAIGPPATCWVAIADADDFVVVPREIAPAEFKILAELGMPLPQFITDIRQLGEPQQLELVPWGWTDSMAALARARGWLAAAPPRDVVRAVNSRAFRYLLEQEWQIGLSGSALARTLNELQEAVAGQRDSSRGWILKSNFGMAGRESLRGRGTILSTPALNWARRRLTTAGPIVFEPLVEPIAEAGIQVTVPLAGVPELVGVTPQLVDPTGVYRGSRLGSDADIRGWEPAVNIALQVADRLQRLGYFGPLGIDAMLYRDHQGEIRLRPLQDLNARFTMGRLALGFTRILPAGWCGTWLHCGAPKREIQALPAIGEPVASTTPSGVQIIPTSRNKSVSLSADHQSVLLLASSPELRERTEPMIFPRVDHQAGP